MLFLEHLALDAFVRCYNIVFQNGPLAIDHIAKARVSGFHRSTPTHR